MATGQEVKENGINGHHAEEMGFATRALHSGEKASHWTYSPVVAPLYMSTTFETLDPGNAMYEYSRCDNPTRAELQKSLRSLESANYALAFSSGLGALTTTSYLLKAGQHVLCCDDVYGGTNRYFSKCLNLHGIDTSFVEGTILSNWVDNFIPGKTKMVWIESPTNPTMKIIDIERVAEEIKKLDPECIIVVDNTFMTPVFQSPLKMGADIVLHSCTKYINGHSDLILGAIMLNDQKLYERLKFFQNALGIVPSAVDCMLVSRSIKTLQVRVRQQAKSALEVAQFLEKHSYVDRVVYPGLKSHPQHDLALKQYSGFGGMISIYLKSDGKEEAVKVLQAVNIFKTAVSLGCVCSLIEIPSLMTHSAMAKEERERLNMTDNLLRLSIGLEDVDDLIKDLDQALSQSKL